MPRQRERERERERERDFTENGEVTGSGGRAVLVGDLDPPLPGVLDLCVVDLQLVHMDLLL